MSTQTILEPKSLAIEQILHACIAGDSQAQKIIYERFAENMFRHCYRYVKNEQDAEDVLVNGFLKVYDNLEKFEYRGERSLQAWVKRIMINESLMFLRKNRKINFVDSKVLVNIGTHETVNAQMAAEEIYALVLKLPTGYRTVFNLYVIEGFSHKEIANQLGITENTSKSQLSKGKAMLRRVLEKNGIYHAD